ncbi:MAG TPA: D-alanyl-D-alanine carboxypeptidase family protein [Lamprocystis sp. (in: g-proteobacteria)]|nr:D-alanyl-D-alanine carboxypeptidase family protein [Lamprocystis sp. (in: g-proteobacteria)]
MKLLPGLLLLCLTVVVAGSLAAADVPSGPAPLPAATPTVPAPPQVEAKGYLLIDFNTGAVLAESNADQRLEPASLTKIMTGYTIYRELAAGRVHLTDQVLISENAWRTGGSKMFVEVGKQISLEDLLKGMIIQSGNDASIALAEHVAGSEQVFSELMNTNTKRLGMENSHFVNVTGLPDPNHFTTARDIARVTAALIREFPQYYVWDGTKEYEFNGIKQQNRNRLLWRDSTVDGVKTGYTENAGYCLVASARRDGMRLISVVLGAKTPEARAVASLELLNYGFRFYESHRLYPGGEPLENLRVWKGDQKEVPVGPARDVYATIPRGRYAELAARMDKVPTLTAPITRGAQLGEVVVTLAGQEVSRVPLVALQDVAAGGLWDQARDTVLQWF